ncbi:hypothetical protein [Actinoplanes sp. ATCC 53533]|uniref:hypothetical protein n=1 Tax=Actinoplanes sp. ATCC 53533 TaxID=1288362 RepID=UPI0013157B37|nr:hypothetical protein [Actinoplanes sp. ATCC 53533]
MGQSQWSAMVMARVSLSWPSLGDAVHGVVVDEELAAVVTGETDVFVVGGQHNVDDRPV